MVNSGSFSCNIDQNTKHQFKQSDKPFDGLHSPSLTTANSIFVDRIGFSKTADSFSLPVPAVAHAIGHTTTKAEYNCAMMSVNGAKNNFAKNITCSSSKLTKMCENFNEEDCKMLTVCSEPQCPENSKKTGVLCSVPLEKVEGLASGCDNDFIKILNTKNQLPNKLLCLFCECTFVTANLRQRHVDRHHCAKQNRRLSSRKINTQQKFTTCVYCGQMNTNDYSLKELFSHLISVHSNKYFACYSCEDRFPSSLLLKDHNLLNHKEVLFSDRKLLGNVNEKSTENINEVLLSEGDEDVKRITRNKKINVKSDTCNDSLKQDMEKSVVKLNKSLACNKELKSKKLLAKNARIGIKRNTRLQIKLLQNSKNSKKMRKPLVKLNQVNLKSIKKQVNQPISINPYPEFDSLFQVKRITDHSIDNLRISTLTFNDVFDKAFFTRIKCNIQENLINHIDGKLFRNEESESRISNFEKLTSLSKEVQRTFTIMEHCGCDPSLNVATPVSMLLPLHYLEDCGSQVEYGSKASKKKATNDRIHYKYFTRHKYQASILESIENRDLSKLDIWTQLIIKNRQQRILDDKKSPKELLEYTKGQEYRTKLQQRELNRILDKRGPFEDLIEEATKKAALDKLHLHSDHTIEESFSVITEIISDMVNKICNIIEQDSLWMPNKATLNNDATAVNSDAEISKYLKLICSSSVTNEDEIDRSDKITLICSSQETEDFQVPTIAFKNKNRMVELTGEWARTRIYICAACGLKLSNMKLLLEHKVAYHQYVWCQHYEFVGNQSELYKHVSIPGLGKVGEVENKTETTVWQKSDARLCSKCSKLCNSINELHRHILECGGDWSWMLGRKKYKYRPFGSKARRKKRGMFY